MASNDNATQDGSRFQLYGCWRSTCTHRAILALRFHGVDFDYYSIDLTAREQESPEFLAISPDAQVPVLVFGDSVLTQSLAIVSLIESLAEASPADLGDRRLFPVDPEAKARSIAICERVSSYIQPMTLPGAIRRSVRAHFAQEGDADFDQQAKGFIDAMLISNLGLLDAVFARSDGPFALGRPVSAADIFVYPQLLGAGRLGLDLAPFPHLSAQAEAMAELDFVRAADPLALPDAP
ncbi:MAG: glutathione S-transferase family protein [Alphaproteobacteria bacterium]